MERQRSGDASQSCHALGEGLPRTLDDIEGGSRLLADLLGLHNRKELKAFLRVRLVRETLRALRERDSARHGGRTRLDRKRLVAYLSVPANRRLWWRYALQDRENSGDGLPPPSLEMGALTGFDRDFLDVQIEFDEVASALAFAPGLAERVREASLETLCALSLWQRMEAELRAWKHLPEERRQVLTAAVFAVATLADDDRILLRAMELAEELCEEFSHLLGPCCSGAAEPMALWEAECRRLADAASAAIGWPGDAGLIREMRDAVECLVSVADKAREVGKTREFERLLEPLQDRFSAVVDAAGAEWLREPDVWAELEQRWRIYRDRAEEGSDTAELKAALADAIETITRLDSERARFSSELEAVRAALEKIERADGRSDLQARLDAKRRAAELHEREGRLRRQLDEWPEQLLKAGSPPGAAGGEEEAGKGETVGSGKGPTATENLPEKGSRAEGAEPGGEEVVERELVEPDQAASSTDAGATSPVRIDSSSGGDIEAAGAGQEAVERGRGKVREPPEEQPRSGTQPTLHEAVATCWRFLEVGRLGLAVATAREGTRCGIEGLPPASLLSAVALADYLRLPDGPVAAGLKAAFGELDPACASTGDGADRLAGGLLLAAAVLRPSLIAPSTGATVFAREASMPEGLSQLYQLVETVRDRGERLQWVRIDPSVLGGAKSEAAWAAELEGLVSEVEEWREQARQMTMLYAPATMVWRRWLEPSGPLGRLCDDLLSTDLDRVDRVRAAVQELAERDRALQLIADTDRKKIGRPRGKDIHARAREQLVTHLARPVDLARWWLRLMAARPDSSDFLDRELGELREAVAALRPSVEDELARACEEQRGPVACAAGLARHAVQRFCVLFDPEHVVRETEPDDWRVIGSDLLLVPHLRLDEHLEPHAAEDLLDVLLKTASDVESLRRPTAFERAFEVRLERGDLTGARAIVEWLEQTDQEPDERLREGLARRRAQERSKLDEALRATRKRLEMSLAYGQLGEGLRARHDGELVRIERELDGLWRFDEAHASLERIGRDLDATRERFAESALRELEALELIADGPEHARIRQAIESGDVLTAFELLDRVRHGTGEREDEAPADRDPLSEFLPRRADAIVEWVESVKSPAAVVRAVREGDEVAGRELRRVPGAQRTEAAKVLEAWYTLKRMRKFEFAPIETVLAGVGIRAKGARLRDRRETWVEIAVEADVLSDRDVCPVPHFGSGARGRYRVFVVWTRPSEDDLLQLVREHIGGDAAIVLYLGRLSTARREQLGQRCRERQRSCIVLDETLLLFLCGERGSRALPFFLCALPFSSFEPFMTTASNVPPELFYGRRREKQQIASKDGPCFIYGGRQLGKTALLREVERQFHDPRAHRYAKWIDLKAHGIGYDKEPAAIWPLIHYELSRIGVGGDDWPEPNPNIRDRVEAFLRYLREWFAANSGRRLLLLLDEADRFLELDGRSEGRNAMDAYRESARLKGLADVTGRSFKVVFAGLHNVLRTAGQPNHPLGHFGVPINVGPLLSDGEWREAEALIRRPLSAAGFRFESPDLVTRILAQTNYYPSIIQLYGSQLFRAASSRRLEGLPPYRITEDLVDEVYRSRRLRDTIRDRFHLTLQLDQRYEVTAYAMAWEVLEDDSLLVEGLGAKRIEEVAREWWPAGFEETSDFRALLDEMVGLGVLRQIEESEDRYTLRNPNVLLLMGTQEEVGEVLLKERERPHEFEPSFFRARDPAHPDSPRRSPLSFEQEARLGRRANGVSVVCGSIAAGLHDLVPIMQARWGEQYLRVLGHQQDRVGFKKELSVIDQRAQGGTTFFVVQHECPWSSEWVLDAVRRVAKLRSADRFARIVFLADPEHFWVLLPDLVEIERSVEWVSLRQWHDVFVRQWLEDQGFASDVRSREAIAEVTGRWPSLLLRLAEHVDQYQDVGMALERLTLWIGSGEGRETLVGELGLESEEARRVLEPLAHFGEASISDLESFCSDAGVTVETLRLRLRWASRLHLAHRVHGLWSLDPLAAKLIAGTAATPR